IVHVRVGQSGTLKVDALPDKVYHGRVTEVGSSGYAKPNQPDVTFFKVKLLLADADQQLRPGMSVRAGIATRTDPQAVVGPIQAVVGRAPLKRGAAGKGGGAGKAGTKNPAARGAGEESPASDTGTAPEEVKVIFTLAGGKAHQRQVTTGISDE